MRHFFPYFLVAVLASGTTVFLMRDHGPGAQAQPASRFQPEIPGEPRGALIAPPPEITDGQANGELSPDEKINTEVYKRANRSVANITTRVVEVDDFLMRANQREGNGSGAVLDKNGHLLTNYHVIEGARQITAILYDGASYPAKLVGADPSNDLAVLKIEAPKEVLHPIAWGNSSGLLVGLRVFALGNPFGFDRTLTHGIISSLNRSLRTKNGRRVRGVIQTDAAINPGSSGGPLLNTRGEMIGITTAIISDAKQSSGIGLAIPANTAKRVASELIRFGKVIRADSGIFGVVETEKGLLVAELIRGGPAMQAGIRGPQIQEVIRGNTIYRTIDRSKADMIVAIDDKPMRTLNDLLEYVESKKPGDMVTFHVIRDGERESVKIRLVESER